MNIYKEQVISPRPTHTHTNSPAACPVILVGEIIFENHKAYPGGFWSTKIAQKLLFANVIYSLHFFFTFGTLGPVSQRRKEMSQLLCKVLTQTCLSQMKCYFRVSSDWPLPVRMVLKQILS